MRQVREGNVELTLSFNPLLVQLTQANPGSQHVRIKNFPVLKKILSASEMTARSHQRAIDHRQCFFRKYRLVVRTDYRKLHFLTGLNQLPLFSVSLKACGPVCGNQPPAGKKRERESHLALKIRSKGRVVKIVERKVFGSEVLLRQLVEDRPRAVGVGKIFVGLQVGKHRTARNSNSVIGCFACETGGFEAAILPQCDRDRIIKGDPPQRSGSIGGVSSDRK